MHGKQKGRKGGPRSRQSPIILLCMSLTAIGNRGAVFVGGKVGVFKRRDEAVRGLVFGLHHLPQQNTDYCLSRRREGESDVLNKSPQS